MADRFYLNCPLAPGPIELLGAEAHHLAMVCRLHAGDQVYLFNGDGHQYRARIVSVTRHLVNLEVSVVESPARELPIRVQVAAPIPKGDRAQFLIEKLTELGVASFVPLGTHRSIVHPGQGKLEKLGRHVIEASKQCGRNVLLRVEPQADWSTHCRRDDLPAAKFLGHPCGKDPFPRTNRDIALAVGPEGGFTQEEMEMAREAGWGIVDLGPRVLRIETAAILLASWAFRGSLDYRPPLREAINNPDSAAP
jgi:16S rRNA (uracil1498-N3)-methyltransferase